MAHEELPACPGWELAKVRTPRDYKTRLRKRFIDSASDTHSADVSSVFFGHADVEDIQYGKAPPEGTKPDPLNIEKFLRHFASHHLDNANAYNAAKHGLAVTAGNASMKLGDGSVLRQDGDAITFLECVYKNRQTASMAEDHHLGAVGRFLGFRPDWLPTDRAALGCGSRPLSRKPSGEDQAV